MTVFAQPASLMRPTVREHYEETILQPVSLTANADLLETGVLRELRGLFPSGRAQMWGVTPGVEGANLPQIRKMRPGDIVFFSGSKRLYLVGTVALVWHNADLAHRLWGIDDRTGQTWEYMYALTGVRGIDLPMEEVRSLLRWNQRRNVQGFVALQEADGAVLTDLVGFEGGAHAGPPEDPDGPSSGSSGPRAPSTLPSGPSDAAAEAQRRAEQGRLKRTLLPGAEGECALCGRVFPRAFLVAAHIKKRAACNESERWDLGNVAMLACLLGCDSLFEHGFVAVEAGGAVTTSPAAAGVPAAAQYIDQHLSGRSVAWWTPHREQYYAWHRSHTFQLGALPPGDINS